MVGPFIGQLPDERFLSHRSAEIAQLVEQGTENPRVDGSIPPLGTIFISGPSPLWHKRSSALALPSPNNEKTTRCRVLHGRVGVDDP